MFIDGESWILTWVPYKSLSSPSWLVLGMSIGWDTDKGTIQTESMYYAYMSTDMVTIHPINVELYPDLASFFVLLHNAHYDNSELVIIIDSSCTAFATPGE